MKFSDPARSGIPYLYPLLLLAVVALTALLYGYQVPSYPVLDDQPNLEILTELHQGGGDGWWQLIWGNHSGMTTRSIPMLSFVIDAWRAPTDFSDMIRYMRYTNIVLHLLTGMILFGWLRALFNAQAYSKRAASATALCVATLWLLAPIQISTVYYTVQRMAMWPVFFILVALWHYTQLRLNGERWSVSKQLIHLAVVYLVWLPLAIVSKENGVLLPLLLVILEFGLLSRCPTPLTRWLRRGHWAVVVAFLLGAAAVLIDGRLIRYGGPNSVRDFIVTDRVATQAFALWDYARQILFPNIAKMGIYHDDFPIRAINEWPSIAMLCLTACTFIASLCALWSKSRYIRLIGFGIAFFFVGHLLESTVFNLELYFEHRNYLSSIGLMLMAVVAVVALVERIPNSRQWLRVLLVGYLGLMVYYTAIEIGNWRDQGPAIEKFWRNHQGSQRTNFLLAEFGLALDNPDFALQLMNEAPDRLTLPKERSERERLVALKQIYYSLAADIEPAPEYYDRILPPWPGSAILERSTTLQSITDLPDEKLERLDWSQFARTPDAILASGISMKARPYASFMVYAGYLAFRFNDIERAQYYLETVHAQTRMYVRWTAVGLFELAVYAGDLDAARGYVHDFEQDIRAAKVHQFELDKLREKLQVLESTHE